MALTVEEQAELAELIKERLGTEIDPAKLSGDELQELGTLAMNTEPPKPAPPDEFNLGGDDASVFRKVLNASDIGGSLTRKALVQGYDSLAGTKLDEGQKGYKDIGQYQSFQDILRKMGIPEGPQALDLLSKVNPVVGEFYKAVLPQELQPSMRAVGGAALDTVADPTLVLGALAKGTGKLSRAVAPQLERMAAYIYKEPFKGFDTLLKETGAIPKNAPNFSDLIYEYKLTGNMQQLRNKLRDVMRDDIWAKIEPMYQRIVDAGETIDPQQIAKDTIAKLSTETTGSKVGFNQRPALAGVLGDVKSGIQETMDRFRPAGYKDKRRAYLKNLLGFHKENQAYRAAGGVGDQFPLGTVQEGITTNTVPTKVELHGTPANTMSAEPYEVMTQQDLVNVGARPAPDAFNPARETGVEKMNPIPQKQPEDLLQLKQQMTLEDQLKQMVHDLQAPPDKTTYQGEIFNTGLVPRLFTPALKKVQNIRPGQSSFMIAPQRPTPVSKNMSIWEALANKTDLADQINYKMLGGEKGTPKASTKTAMSISEAPASVLRNQIRAKAEKVLGKEQADLLDALNLKYATGVGSMGDLSKEVIKEAGTSALTPLDIGFLANPYSRKMLALKEAAEAARLPKVRTNVGVGMSRVATDLSKADLGYGAELGRLLGISGLTKHPNPPILTEEERKGLLGE